MPVTSLAEQGRRTLKQTGADIYAHLMPQVTNIEDLRRGVAALNLQYALGDPYAVDQINEAVESDSFEEAKARIIEVLHGLEAVSLGGFPIGVELDLVEMVGFDY